MDEIPCDDYNYILKYCYKIELEKYIWFIGSNNEFNIYILNKLYKVNHLKCNKCKKKVYYLDTDNFIVNIICINCKTLIFKCITCNKTTITNEGNIHFILGNCLECSKRAYNSFLEKHLYLDNGIKR